MEIYQKWAPLSFLQRYKHSLVLFTWGYRHYFQSPMDFTFALTDPFPVNSMDILILRVIWGVCVCVSFKLPLMFVVLNSAQLSLPKESVSDPWARSCCMFTCLFCILFPPFHCLDYIRVWFHNSFLPSWIESSWRAAAPSLLLTFICNVLAHNWHSGRIFWIHK